jgi:hypothetical protein
MQVTMTPAEREQAAGSWRQAMAPYLERRTGPRRVTIEATDAPATLWNPMLPGLALSSSTDRFVRSKADGAPLPSSDDDIAFAPVTQLSRWIESRQLTSERLTTIYLARIERLDPKIRAIITLTKDHALARAKAADVEIAGGYYRGPLHGIPYGVKDLLDTKDIATTYGAEPFRNRVPGADSTVVRRLNDAGAVMLAKLSLGALALNDIWFGGQTMNPWLLEEGASGSSAGPGAATAAGLVGFSTYAWLLQSASPTAVSTYAYVNPVVAVFLGWAIAGEPLTARMVVASVVIIGGVALITAARSNAASPPQERSAPLRPRDVRETRVAAD